MRRLHAVRGATCFLDDSDPQAPALVTVLDDVEPEPALLLELETEHRLTRELDIPGVRRVLRRGMVDGRVALYSSWFAGTSLGEVFEASRPPLERVLDLAIKAAELVSRLHAERILHGRLHPRAFRVDAALRELELSGLGSGTRLDLEQPPDAGEFGRDEYAVYAAPEQTGRMNRPVDFCSDLYSLGATYYLMLTGRPPFEAADAGELSYRLIAVQPTPPRELSQDVPQVLSDIVTKLLAKDAQDRYQSADALRADLERCREHWTSSGSIPSFPLAASDSGARFALPRKLHGRDAELGWLHSALEHTTAGACELLLVGGVAGAGKTSLVREVLRPLALRRGRYVEGKFDQFQRELPFSAFAQAFSAWVQQALSESDAELERVRERTRLAVGELGGLLTRLVPDLELVIGEQPPAPEVGPSDALNRFQYVLRRFLCSLSDEAHPLALFIDDLQWADPASLELLSTLMTTRDAKYLLVIGAYRSEELEASHALGLCFAELTRARAPMRRLELQLLDEDAVAGLVSETLASPLERVRPLSSFVWRRTQGNALLVHQFLRSLYEDGLIFFNHVAATWEWELLAIEAGHARLDVLALFGAKTARLPPETRQALIRGAYLGSSFEVRLLASILDRDLAEVLRLLEPAVAEGLLQPVGLGHRYVAAGLEIGAGLAATYVFPHDRVQQAVYSLVPEAERAALHLSIGRRLRDSVESGQQGRAETQIFQVAYQLNRGQTALEGDSERRALAQLNLEAGLSAKRSAAYAAALEYLSIGLELVGQSGWATEHALTLRLHSEAAECAYLAAQLERMQQHAEAVLSNGRTVLEKAPVFLLLVDAYTSQNRLSEALAKGLEALSQLGETFPRAPKVPHIMLGLGRTKLRLAGKDVPGLARQRAMIDPHKQQAMLLLERMVPPAYMSGSPLFPLLVFAMVDLSVKYGNSPLSAFGYASFGITLSGVLGDISGGTLFGKLGLETLERTRAEPFRVKVMFVLYVFIRHYTEPLASCAAPLLAAYRAGMEAGNLVGATWSAYYRLLWLYFTGRPLAELEREAAAYSAVFHDLGQEAAYRRNDMLRQVMLNLMGRTADAIAFSGETYRDVEIESLTAKGDDATSRFFYYFNKQMLCLLFGKPGAAVGHGDSARSLTDAVIGLPDAIFWAFWDALSRIRHSESTTPSEAARLRKEAAAHCKKLRKWGAHGPANYQHKHDLVRAELYRVEGKPELARELYDRAIDGASEHGYVQEAALAEELAGRFHSAAGRQALGRWYLERARADYLRWGALAKADALEHEVGAASSGATPSVGSGTPIDVATFVKAAQAISGEIVLERLAAKLLDIVVENAGAERGALVLYERDEGRVVAQKPAANAPVETGLDLPLAASRDLPASVLQYVARSKRPLVVDDMGQEPRFAHDPAASSLGLRSVLCAPVVHHGDLIACVYLDNRLAPRVFTTERLQLLTVLGGQIAVSLENAKLYGNLQASLERQVELTRAYSRFTPRSFLDILDRESILDVRLGDHRHGDMTVMFLDIREYTKLSEELSTADNFRFLNGFFRRMTGHVTRNSGVVVTFTGDGFCAFFPGKPSDAFAAAVDMQAAVRAYNAERVQKRRTPVAAGIGLHTGPLMLGVIGDQDRMEASLIADAVNTASRMEGLTKEFRVGIVASETTVTGVADAMERGVRRVGDVKVKGKTTPTRVFDCFAGDAPEVLAAKRATLPEFQRGLEAWQAADFETALASFTRVTEVAPFDGTAQRYLLRVREAQARGAAGADWTGVEVMDRK